MQNTVVSGCIYQALKLKICLNIQHFLLLDKLNSWSVHYIITGMKPVCCSSWPDVDSWRPWQLYYICTHRILLYIIHGRYVYFIKLRPKLCDVKQRREEPVSHSEHSMQQASKAPRLALHSLRLKLDGGSEEGWDRQNVLILFLVKQFI